MTAARLVGPFIHSFLSCSERQYCDIHTNNNTGSLQEEVIHCKCGGSVSSSSGRQNVWLSVDIKSGLTSMFHQCVLRFVFYTIIWLHIQTFKRLTSTLYLSLAFCFSRWCPVSRGDVWEDGNKGLRGKTGDSKEPWVRLTPAGSHGETHGRANI